MRSRTVPRTIARLATIAVALALTNFLLAQTSRNPVASAARGAESTPNFSGVWSPARGTVRGFGDVNSAPMLPWAAEKYKAVREGVEDPADSGNDDLDP